MTVKYFYTSILGFLTGIVVQQLFENISISYFLTVCASALLLLILMLRKKYIGLMLLLIFSMMLGFLRADNYADKFNNRPLDIFADQQEEFIIVGRVVSDPVYTNLYQRFVLDTESISSRYSKKDFSLETRILVSSIRDVTINYGDVVNVTGVVRKPDSFITESGREFDYSSYLKNDGILYTSSFAEIEMVEKASRSTLGFLYKIKNDLLANIYRLIPSPESGLLAGILFGQDGGLDEKTEEKFRVVGLMHIVVLSGYNVSLVIKILTGALRFLPRIPRSLIAVLGIAAFALLVGAGPTVIRASIMAVFIVLADTLGARYNISRALMIAGVAMVAYNPRLLLFDISFQLSFLATYGLIVIAPYIERKLSFLPKYLAIRESAVATISAQIMVLPLLIYQIGEFSLISPLVNVLVLFAVPYAMLAGFLTAISDFIMPFISEPLAYLSTYLLKYQLIIVNIFSGIPYGSITIPPFSIVWMFVMYGVLGYWIYRIQSAQKLKV